MAKLYATSPNGTAGSIQLETMNITADLNENGYCILPTGFGIQWCIVRGAGSFSNITFPLQHSILLSVWISAETGSNTTGCFGWWYYGDNAMKFAIMQVKTFNGGNWVTPQANTRTLWGRIIGFFTT